MKLMTALTGRRRIARIAIALALAIPAGAVLIPPTSALASCTGTCLDNTDPYQTGCNAGMYIVKDPADPVYGGTFELWYGPSASCGTNWAEDISISTVPHYIWAVRRQYSAVTKSYIYTETSHYLFQFIGQAWSNQIWAATAPADACEQEYYISNKTWGPVVCTGQFTMPGATMIG